MGQFKESLKQYEENTDLLKEFRVNIMNEYIGIQNNISNQRKDIERYSYEEDFESEDLREFDENYNEVSVSTVIDIFNQINISITEIPSYDTYSSEVDCHYSYCSFNELWELLCDTSDFDFFVTIGYISQMNEYNKTFKELQKSIKVVLRDKGIKFQSIKSRVFIAMSFDEKLLNVKEALSKAIQSEGLLPILIDEKEHSNQIVPEIFSEIDKADFVVADLTQHKTGVYYEAGYAKGKGKVVIFTCRKDDFEGKHFDVAQDNMIVWKDEKDLMERLIRRIEAMHLQPV